MSATLIITAREAAGLIRREATGTPKRCAKSNRSPSESHLLCAQMQAAAEILEEAGALGADHPINRDRTITVSLTPEVKP